MDISSLALVRNVNIKKGRNKQKIQTQLMSFAFKCATNVSAQTVPPRSHVPAHPRQWVWDSLGANIG